MVYKNKLIAAIQVAGKTLRECGEVIELPFSSEYSIFLKNLETRKCKLNIKIDGKNVTNDGLILNPLSQINLERFLDSDRKFKFIEKSKEIEEFRGNKPEDGLIEIQYSFEEILFKSPVIDHTYRPFYDDNNWKIPRGPCDIPKPLDVTYGVPNITANSMSNFSGIIKCANFDNDAGITVEGSKSNQTFQECPDFYTGAVETIIFKIVGTNGNIVTTKTKKQCSSCGKLSKSKYEYCPKCGTFLK